MEGGLIEGECLICGVKCCGRSLGDKDGYVLIRLLLDIERERVEDKLLDGKGGDGDWIRVCEPCGLSVEKARQIYEELVELLNRFEEIRGKVVESVKKGGASATGTRGDLCEEKVDKSKELVVKCRQFVRKRKKD